MYKKCGKGEGKCSKSSKNNEKKGNFQKKVGFKKKSLQRVEQMD